MMQKNRVSIEWQNDEKLYQFLCPFEGNWLEVKVCALDLVRISEANIEANKKKEEEVAQKLSDEPKSE